MKAEAVTEQEARLLTVKAALAGAINSSDIVPIVREYEEPHHPEFAERNRWSLYNAFTETAKKYTPPRADVCYRRLGGLFGLR